MRRSIGSYSYALKHDMMKLTIGISHAPEDNPKYRRYAEAIKKAAIAGEYDVEVVELSRNPSRVKDLDGIVFTGGADIDPARYGKQAEISKCGEIDEARDQAEFALAQATEDQAIPTLG